MSYWVRPCFEGDVALGAAAVDLTPFSEGASEVAPVTARLTPLTLEGEAENPLLTEASIAVAVTLTAPLLTPEEAAAACVISLTVTKIAPVPDSLKAVSAAASNPFTFTAGMPLAGIEPVMVAGGALDVETGEIVWATSTAKYFLPGWDGAV